MNKGCYFCNPFEKNGSSSPDRRLFQQKQIFDKSQKNLDEIIKAHTFAIRLKKHLSGVWKSGRWNLKSEAWKFFESLEAIAHKSSIYGKVILAKNIDNMTSNFERNMIVSIKTHLQWRVWSWLRMNASGRLNTCKSWGSAGSNTWRRPANGCGTRTQPSFKWGIAQGNLD